MINTENLKIKEWEESYKQKQNFIYYPKEELIIFLNKYIKKRLEVNKFKTILKTDTNIIKALDYGCGIGRATICLQEFDIKSVGVDISETAITEAKKLATSFGYNMDNQFIVTKDNKLSFENNYFDIAICDGVLDSMSFNIAKNVMQELNRCTKSTLFFSCIGYSDKENSQAQQLIKNCTPISKLEYEINTEHENKTIQTFYTQDSIKELLSETQFKIKESKQVNKINLSNNIEIENRYFVVATK